MSLTATAVRLVEHGPLPAILVCQSLSGHDWFFRSPEISTQLWPRTMPGPSTYAYDFLNNGEKTEACGEVSACGWLNHWVAEKHHVHEHSLKTSYGMVLLLLWCKDEQMLIRLDEYQEEVEARRSDERG